MVSRIARVGGLTVLVAGLTSYAFAQAGRSGINGVVFDQGKAVLPGATVTATNEATGLARETVTGPDGRFIISTLTPGNYTVSVELQGFQMQRREQLGLAVGQELTVDFTLGVQGLAETVTVTGESPVVEITSSRVGTNVTPEEIDSLPSAGRSSLSLMQLVPGLTPSLAPGTFEGGQFNANGRDTGSNLFMVDGVYNNDERNGGSQGDQARISLDTMAEFQVLTHQYTAEFGGSSGVIVNAVTKSGTNRISGRGFYYFQDDSLNSTDPFLKARGEKNPESGSDVYGFQVGGPLIRNKAFYFFNLERTLINQAVQLDFPPQAAPLAVDFSDAISIKSLNTFVRGDYQAGAGHNISFRWSREASPTIGENWEENRSTADNIFIEQDAGDHLFSGNWTSILGNRATNEFKVTHVREDLLQGNTQYFDDSLNFIELNGRDQFDIGSDNRHQDFAAGPRATHGTGKGRTYVIEDAFTFVKNGWGGDHTFKAGLSHTWSLVRPRILGGNDNGTVTFRHNLPFDPASAFTYPSRFSIRLGEIYFNLADNRTTWFLQDKLQLSRNLTLNLGVRYDYQTLTEQTKDTFAPRLGFAYDPTGSGKTVIRGGVGKFYEYAFAGVEENLVAQAVIGPAFTFDTGEDRAADTGRIPTHVCLQPSGSNGLAVISPACRSFLINLRNQVSAGGFVNNEPTVDGNRRLGYLWSYSLGVKREVMRNLAVSADYVGNRGRDQTGLIDINEGPPGPGGVVTRPGVNGFDPTGELIPPGARNTTYLRVLQYQTREDLKTDFNSLELALEKRSSDRWSGRVAYTLARARDVGTTGGGTTTVGKRYSNDLNPREDYGRTNFDNRHALAFGFNVDPWRGLGAGAVFRYYSGYPINETVGSDLNSDRDNFERPVRGVNDLARPILSPVDSNGLAIRNGIDGEDQILLDLRFQYIVDMPRSQTLGFFWEIYNATNRINFQNPTGNRLSSQFMIPVVAGDMRTMQLGVRYTF
jgi:hypothetical protein